MKQRLKAVALAIGCALTVAPACAEPVQLTPLDKNFTLQVLGSGGPISDDQRASSSEVIWWKGKSRILIDAGGGVYLRFGQAGAKLEEVDFIGITHFHTDHVTDLPALLKGADFFERSDPLDLAGPEAGSAFPSMSGYFDALFNKDKGAYAYLSGFKDGTDGLFPITLHDVPYQSPQPHTVYQQDGLTITASDQSYGYRMNVKVRYTDWPTQLSEEYSADNLPSDYDHCVYVPCEHFEDDTGDAIVGMMVMIFVVIFIIVLISAARRGDGYAGGFGTRYVFVNHLWYPAGPDGRPRPGSVGTKTKPRPPRRGGGGFGGGSRGGGFGGGGFGGGSHCACASSCACACACACAGGGRAGCSAKNLYGVGLDETLSEKL